MCGLTEELDRIDHGIAEELRQFLAHYRTSKANFQLSMQVNGHDGNVMHVWVGGRRFRVDPRDQVRDKHNPLDGQNH